MPPRSTQEQIEKSLKGFEKARKEADEYVKKHGYSKGYGPNEFDDEKFIKEKDVVFSKFIPPLPKTKKSPTKKAIKMLMKEVDAEVIAPKIKTGKVKKLLKAVESKAVEHEGNQLIKKIGSKIKKKKDISDIKQMLQQSEEFKPQYISTKEVEETIKDMEYYIATTKLPKGTISHAKMKSKLIADKMKSEPSIIPILRTQLLKYNYPIIYAFYKGYPELFKELYPKTDEMKGKHKEFMEKIAKDEIKEAKKKATKEKAVEAKAKKAEDKEKFSKTREMTPEEIKKFNQAKAYITRVVNKTSGKHKDLNLDKDDIGSIARDLAYTGFTRMSEPLFLKTYKEYMDF